MVKLVKFVLGLLLLPLCVAGATALYRLSLLDTAVWNDPGSMALPAGFVSAAILFFVMPRTYRTYVLGHELTHALFGMLAGARVGRIRVSDSGGHVMLSKTNVLISLAPYFFPLYTMLAIAVWMIASRFTDLSGYRAPWLALIGLTWGFHITFTLYMLAQKQPDIEQHGRLFSYTVIFAANLFFVALWIIGFGSVGFADAWRILLPETTVAYTFVYSMLQRTAERLKTFL